MKYFSWYSNGSYNAAENPPLFYEGPWVEEHDSLSQAQKENPGCIVTDDPDYNPNHPKPPGLGATGRV